MAQTVLEILIQAVDDASGALANVADGLGNTGNSATTAQEQLKAYGDAMETAGTQLAAAGAVLEAFYGGVVLAAAGTQEANDSLSTSVGDIVKSANAGADSQKAYATQVSFLQDKINAEKASIESSTATLDKNTGSAQSVAAAHAKAAASIATAQGNITKYQQELDLLTTQQGLVGASADDITASFEALARKNTSLGFSIVDSTGSLKNLFAAIKDPVQAATAYQTAMDLARAKNEDLGTATQQVIMAMQGQGRALVGVGINIKDGLSGMDALSAIQGVVGGQAQDYSQTLNGQMSAALQNINKLFSDMGTTQLPILQNIFGAINNVITAVDNWTNAHPKLTQAILIFVGALGAALIVLGAIIAGAGVLAVALAGGLSAAFLGIGAVVALVVAALAVGVAEIIQHWTAISDFIKQNWELILAILLPGLGTLVDFFVNHFAQIKQAVEDVMNWMAPFIKGVFSVISDLFNATFGPIEAAIKAVSGAVGGASGIGKAIGGVLGSVANVITAHDAVITPGGQVVQTDPSDYLIATKTPGSLGGGSGLTVNLNGGMFLNNAAVTLLANTIAKQTNRSIKTRNYAS